MPFVREKHIRYWRMCAKCLPDHYISNDSNRMTLGFFIVSALDILDELDNIDQSERQSWISWIYSCQVPEGGFRGFAGTDLGQARSSQNLSWDPAHLPATFFALATLIILGDDLSRVRRPECLAWVGKLQRQDGSFGEVLGENNTIEGDRDLRQCCCAAGIVYMLRDSQHVGSVFDEVKLIHYIQTCQDMSGGFGVSPFREPHSGLSYCAIAGLSFLEGLRGKEHRYEAEWIPNTDQCVKWLLERQTNIMDNAEEVEDEDEEDENIPSCAPDTDTQQLQTSPDISIAGFNGRAGKIADTCYAFWNVGSLAILEKEDLIDANAMRQYLFEVTQHRIGGFGKGRDDPPDVLHSYLGLAALAVLGEPGLKSLDPTMCMSTTSAKRLEQINIKADNHR